MKKKIYFYFGVVLHLLEVLKLSIKCYQTFDENCFLICFPSVLVRAIIVGGCCYVVRISSLIFWQIKNPPIQLGPIKCTFWKNSFKGPKNQRSILYLNLIWGQIFLFKKMLSFVEPQNFIFASGKGWKRPNKWVSGA